MRSPIKLALVLTLLIEALNLRFCAFPVDAGLPATIPWYTRLLADQWLLLHLPGVVSLGLLKRLGLERCDSLVMFVSGYVETAALLIVCIVIWQWLREMSARHSASPEPPAILHD